MSGALLVAALLCAAPARAAPCAAQSAGRTAALVELYTAGRCAGCQPAERWLANLGRRFAADRVVPLSLDVDAWDYLGRKDPYIERKISARERKLSLLQRTALVYTPQVVVQGREFPAWSSDAFDAEIRRINARPPRARLALEIRNATPRGLETVVQAQVLDPAQRGEPVLYLGALENRVDHYVLWEWQGPILARPDGRFEESRTLALLPKATPRTSGVAAFVQDRQNGEVLQALVLSACSP